MNRFKKWLIPVATACLLLASLVGCSNTPASLGEIFDPSGNPFASRFSDVKDVRTATFVVAASDSVHKFEADYFCNGTNDHVQIQAALDALPATGGEVLLLDGTYAMSTAVTMDSYQTLRGCGRNTVLNTEMNEHFITATGGSGTEKVGILIADICFDGDIAINNDCGVRWDYVDNSKILHCWFSENGEYDIYLQHSDRNEIVGNDCEGGWQHAIYLNPNCYYNRIAENTITGKTEVGIFLQDDCCYNTITGNTVENGGDAGIELYEPNCHHNTIVGNTVRACDLANIYSYGANTYNTITGNTIDAALDIGISLYAGANHNSIVGNTVKSSADEGIDIDTCHYNIISNNVVSMNGRHGIRLDRADHNIVSGNNLYANSQTTDNTYDNIFLEISDDNIISENLCRQGAETNQPRYGINVSIASCDRNRVFDNDLYDSGQTAPFNDAGTNTELPSVTVPFSDGFDAQDSGYLIDANTEYARAWSFLNKEVVQVVRIKVYARSVVAEADKMRGEFVIYGGADNEAYTTHNGSVANHPSTSGNFAIDDVIYWTITEAGVLALLGGDSVEVKVLHEAVGDGDIDTQAYFRTVTIEYV